MSRGKKRRSLYLRWVLLAQVLAIAVCICGCASYVALEDRAFVMAIGIDREEDGYRISYAFPDLAELTGNSKGGYEKPLSFVGDSLEDARMQYEKTGKRSVDYGQVKVLIIGESLLDDEKALEKILVEMTENPEFARTILLCGVEGEAKAMIDLDREVEGSIGIYLEELFENNGKKMGYETVILNDVSGMGTDQQRTELAIPLLKIEEKRPILEDRISIFVLAHPGRSLYTVG